MFPYFNASNVRRFYVFFQHLLLIIFSIHQVISSDRVSSSLREMWPNRRIQWDWHSSYGQSAPSYQSSVCSYWDSTSIFDSINGTMSIDYYRIYVDAHFFSSGAIVYVELATSIPDPGADYAYAMRVGWKAIAFAFMLVSVSQINQLETEYSIYFHWKVFHSGVHHLPCLSCRPIHHIRTVHGEI